MSIVGVAIACFAVLKVLDALVIVFRGKATSKWDEEPEDASSWRPEIFDERYRAPKVYLPDSPILNNQDPSPF